MFTSPTRDIRSIKGLSERRRLPRLGKIRLGIKKTGVSGPYPAETEHFVCPPEVQKVYGQTPLALDIMFPLDDLGAVFPQAYKWYGSGAGLRCKGDGQVALRRWADVEPPLQAKINQQHDPNDLVEIPCPCPRLKSGDCGAKGHLMILLPRVSLSGVYQLDTGSHWNIVEMNSSLDFLRGLLGRIAMIPLTLRREPTDLTYQGKRRTHYLLKLSFDGNIDAVKQIRETTSRAIFPALAVPVPSDEGNGLVSDTAAPNAPPESPTIANSARTGAAPETPAAATSTDTPPAAPSPPASPTADPAPSTAPAQPSQPDPQATRQPPTPTDAPLTCSCGATVTANVADYSRRYFQEIFCMDCQKKRFGNVSGGKKT